MNIVFHVHTSCQSIKLLHRAWDREMLLHTQSYYSKHIKAYFISTFTFQISATYCLASLPASFENTVHGRDLVTTFLCFKHSNVSNYF